MAMGVLRRSGLRIVIRFKIKSDRMVGVVLLTKTRNLRNESLSNER